MKSFKNFQILCNLSAVQFVLLVKGLSKEKRSMLMKPAVEILIERYRNNLYVMAFSVCKNTQDAEDVVQDTFIQYWSQKKEFES